MRHVRMLGLCLVAVFAVAAVAASSAVAGPQWVKCENIGSGGNYTGPNCTKAEKAKPKGTGEYELYKAPEVAAKRVAEGKSANVPFSGGSISNGGVLTSDVAQCLGGTYNGQRLPRHYCEEGGGELEESGEEYISVECEGETNTGEAEGKNKVANVNATFTGCAAFGFLPCNSAGAEEGEVQTNTLKGKLGWINKAAKEVGVLLEPAAGKHARFAEFVCGGSTKTGVGVGSKKEGTWYTGPNGETEGGEEKHGGYDGIISPITPVNEMTNTFEQVFAVDYSNPVKNIPSKLEGKHIDVLEAYLAGLGGEPNGEGETFSSLWAGAGEELTNANTPEEEGEIKA